jgi:hypothetical protein
MNKIHLVFTVHERHVEFVTDQGPRGSLPTVEANTTVEKVIRKVVNHFGNHFDKVTTEMLKG